MLFKMIESVWTEDHIIYGCWNVFAVEHFWIQFPKTFQHVLQLKYVVTENSMFQVLFSDSEENQNDLVSPMQLMKNDLVLFI